MIALSPDRGGDSYELLLSGLQKGSFRYRYFVASLSDLVGSHYESLTGLVPDARYPDGVQARTYSTVSPDVEAYRAAQRTLRPEMLLDRTAFAAFGPPIVAAWRSPSGFLYNVIVAGNQRLLLLRHMYESRNSRGAVGLYQATARRLYLASSGLDDSHLPCDWVIVRKLDLTGTVNANILRLVNRLSDSAPVKARDGFALVRSLHEELRGNEAVLRYFIGCLTAEPRVRGASADSSRHVVDEPSIEAIGNDSGQASFEGFEAITVDQLSVQPAAGEGHVSSSGGDSGLRPDGPSVDKAIASSYRSKLLQKLAHRIKRTWDQRLVPPGSLREMLFEVGQEYGLPGDRSSSYTAPLLTSNDRTHFVEFRNGREQLSESAAFKLAELAESLLFGSPDVLYEFIYWGCAFQCRDLQSFPGADAYRSGRQVLMAMNVRESYSVLQRITTGLGQAIRLEIMLDPLVLKSQNSPELATRSVQESAQETEDVSGIELLDNGEALAWLYTSKDRDEGQKASTELAVKTAEAWLERARPLWMSEPGRHEHEQKQQELIERAREFFGGQISEAIRLRKARASRRRNLRAWCKRYLEQFPHRLSERNSSTGEQGRPPADSADLHFCLFLAAQQPRSTKSSVPNATAAELKEAYSKLLADLRVDSQLVGKKLSCPFISSVFSAHLPQGLRAVQLLSTSTLSKLIERHREEVDGWMSDLLQSGREHDQHQSGQA